MGITLPAELRRQEKSITRELNKLRRRIATLEQRKHGIFLRRWMQSVQELVGKEVVLTGTHDDPPLSEFNNAIGTLLSTSRNKCRVTFGNEKTIILHPLQLRAANDSLWDELMPEC